MFNKISLSLANITNSPVFIKNHPSLDKNQINAALTQRWAADTNKGGNDPILENHIDEVANQIEKDTGLNRSVVKKYIKSYVLNKMAADTLQSQQQASRKKFSANTSPSQHRTIEKIERLLGHIFNVPIETKRAPHFDEIAGHIFTSAVATPSKIKKSAKELTENITMPKFPEKVDKIISKKFVTYVAQPFSKLAGFFNPIDKTNEAGKAQKDFAQKLKHADTPQKLKTLKNEVEALRNKSNNLQVKTVLDNVIRTIDKRLDIDNPQEENIGREFEKDISDVQQIENEKLLESIEGKINKTQDTQKLVLLKNQLNKIEHINPEKTNQLLALIEGKIQNLNNQSTFSKITNRLPSAASSILMRQGQRASQEKTLRRGKNAPKNDQELMDSFTKRINELDNVDDLENLRNEIKNANFDNDTTKNNFINKILNPKITSLQRG